MATTTPQLDLSQTPDTMRAFCPQKRTPIPDIVAALRTIAPLDGLTDEEYTWIATHGNERIADDGALLFQENEPATNLNFILKGEVHVRRRHAAISLFIGRAGQMTGKLPFSRMKTYGGDGYTVGPAWAIDVPETLFPAMIAAIPSMAQRSVSALLDRVREVTRLEQQAEKLTALGKLAGNLAHELNNPASAAQRSAATLVTELRKYGEETFRLGALNLPPDQIDAVRNWVTEARLLIDAAEPKSPESLAESDREEVIQRWLADHNVPDPWDLAPTLAEANISIPCMEKLLAIASPDVFPLGICAFSSSLRAERMAATVLDSTVRIFDLISAIKDYSYMDQAPFQEVDIAQSVENTLAMFNSRLGNHTVEVSFDPHIPTLRAYGSELNQVWTALIENALDALDAHAGRGTLRLTTRLSGSFAMVEISNDGPPIRAEIRSRIFEPFFTTKAPGHGLGLGLDTAQRIVSKHSGFISADTLDGFTCFQVRLPIEPAEAY
jgi:signal transduction histidine kinase